MASTSLNNLNKVLTPLGYSLRKGSLSAEQITQIKTELTVAPIVAAKFAAQQQEFKIFRESATRYYVPRYWGLEKYGQPDADTLSEGISLPKTVLFTGSLRPKQEEIVNLFLKKPNGIISERCGGGKTVMAINTGASIGKRFIVIVDQSFLMNQWIERIAQFLPQARVGIIQGDKCETDPTKYDITIAMIQTLCQREYPEDTFTGFGLAIYDEVHTMATVYFSKALKKVQTRNTMGLSATPTRDDGLHKVFEWFIGPYVYWEKEREPDPNVLVRCIQYKNKDAEYNEIPKDYKNDIVLPTLLGKVVRFAPRNEMIMQIIVEILMESPMRKILVMGEYTEQLDIVENGLISRGTVVKEPVVLPAIKSRRRKAVHPVHLIVKKLQQPLVIGYYIGGMHQDDLDETAAKANVLMATYAMASKALDIGTLNAIIYMSPRVKVEQSSGRILRGKACDRILRPLIIDIVDPHGVYQSQWRKRRLYYIKCAYTIQRENRGPSIIKVSDSSSEASDTSDEELNKEINCVLLED